MPTNPSENSSTQSWRPATRAVRGGTMRTGFEETSEALFLTSGFIYTRAADAEATFTGELDRFTYTRYDNPTTTMFEERLRLIEGAEAAQATSTGMSAVFAAVAALVSSGDRIVASSALFGSTVAIFNELLPRWGVTVDYVDCTSIECWESALATPAKVVFFETPSNPMLQIVDIAAVSELAHRAGATVIIDNVFATPILQRPIEFGADVVVYSATKHIDGQGRVLGGAVLGPREFIEGPLRTFVRNTGPTISPFNSWVLLKGLETMPIRVAKQSENALALASWLEAQPEVARVHYPLLESHPQRELAASQMDGGGTIVAVDLRGPSGTSADDVAAGKAHTFAVMDRLSLINISNNLGDSRTMVTHPATTTHCKLSEEGRAALGITPTSLRISVGLEDVRDVEEDLAQALRG